MRGDEALQGCLGLVVAPGNACADAQLFFELHAGLVEVHHGAPRPGVEGLHGLALGGVS